MTSWARTLELAANPSAWGGACIEIASDPMFYFRMAIQLLIAFALYAMFGLIISTAFPREVRHLSLERWSWIVDRQIVRTSLVQCSMSSALLICTSKYVYFFCRRCGATCLVRTGARILHWLLLV